MSNYPVSPYKSKKSTPKKAGDNWAMLCHISGFLGFLLPGVGHILGPLVVWLFKREEYDSVAYHGKEALNFQIAMTVYMIIACMLFFVFIGIFIIPLVAIFWFILIIIASLRAADGQAYRYPLIFRII